MRFVVAAIVLIACSPAAMAPSPSAAPIADATASPETSATPEPTLTPGKAPLAEQPPVQHTPPPMAPNPSVAIVDTTFSIGAPSAVEAKPLADHIRSGVPHFLAKTYLPSLDRYRAGVDGTAPGPDFVPPPDVIFVAGRAKDVILAAVKADIRPGERRSFELESATVESAWGKPWSQESYVDVSLTVADRGAAGDVVRETGRLRLTIRPQIGYVVLDAWDGARGAWMHGVRTDRAQLTKELRDSLPWYLGQESWVPGQPPVTYIGPGPETPYKKARAAYLASARDGAREQHFEGVTASIASFQTYTALGDGLGLVVLRGKVFWTDTAGVERSRPFERRVRALRQVFGGDGGGWQVVDEQDAQGRWMSGGDLALKDADQRFG